MRSAPLACELRQSGRCSQWQIAPKSFLSPAACPTLQSLPLESVAAEAARLIAEDGLVALQYGSGQGILELREQICQVMALEGITAHPDDVTVTVGSQMALDLVTRIFCDPGDVILAEAPSYVGALTTFASYQAKVVHIEMDLRWLESRPRSAPPSNRCETPADASNSSTRSPTSTTRPVSPCRTPAGRSWRRSVGTRTSPILEDNPYGLLGFDDKIRRAIRADDADNVIYLGSFSKTFAPGLRVGWVLAPHAVREKLVLANESATLTLRCSTR